MILPLTWIGMGLLLVLFEFAIPGFIISFFGLGAILTGILVWMFPEHITTAWQIISFAVFSSILLLGVRRFIPGVFKGKSDKENPVEDGEEYKGSPAVVTETIRPGVPGKVLCRGSVWSAEASREIPAGTNVVVEYCKNITLFVK